MNEKEFNHWFSGLVSVKGCFEIHVHGNPVLIIRIKKEDRAILDFISNEVGGNVNVQSSGFAQWRSGTDAESLRVLVDIFSRVPMMTRKQKDFDIWKQAAEKVIGRGFMTEKEINRLRDRMLNLRANRVAA